MAFATQEDIGNRALQHCGARRIASFSDNSRNAAEVSFAYDKLRVAELRRSVWRFATRRAVLRALTTTSLRFVPPVWSNATAYLAGQIVRDSTGVYWICLIANTGNTPGVPVTGFPPYWTQYFGPVHGDAFSSAATYYAGDIVYVGSTFYMSNTNSSINLNPPTNLNIWVAQPAASLTFTPMLLGPAGPGVTVNSRQRNIFPLPNGYLRLAAVDPKVESTSNLTTTGAIQFNDWMLEGNILVSNSPGPIFPFRFVADLSDVTAMDSLFCEALGARLGYEVCETLTQSNVKLQAIGAAYQKFIRDARIVNQIETGATEPMEEELQLTQGPQGVQESPQGAQAQQA